MSKDKVGRKITGDGLPESLTPFVCGFAGYGNVSCGAQEIYDLLPVEEICPKELGKIAKSGVASNRKVYKVVFREEDIVEPKNEAARFELLDYYNHPEKYRSQFERYLPHLQLLKYKCEWQKM